MSDVADFADAQVCVTFNDGWDRLGLTGRLVELQQRCRRARGFGDFWQHMLVAEGAVDVAIDAVGIAIYDVAAVRVIVEEAGGVFTDRHGEATHEHDTAISTNGVLHDRVIALLTPDVKRRSVCRRRPGRTRFPRDRASPGSHRVVELGGPERPRRARRRSVATARPSTPSSH